MPQATAGERLVALGELRIGIQQAFQITMEKSVIPHRAQQSLEVKRLVLDLHLPLRRQAQELVDTRFVLPEQLCDDRLLVGKW